MPAVLVLWQVAHTIVLRYALIVVLGILAWPRAVASLARPASPLEGSARAPFAVYGVFIAWCIFVVAAMNPGIRDALSELRAQWLAPTLVLLLGYGLGLRHGGGNTMVRVVFLGLVLHAFMQLVSAPVMLAKGREIPYLEFAGVSDHKANVTYTNALALAMLVADAAARAAGGRGFLGIDWRWALGAFLLMLVSTVAATTRNGLIVFGLLTAAGFAVVALQMRARASRRAWATLLACAAIAFVGAVVGLKADPRWSSFRATVPVAWDTDGHREWLLGEHNVSHLPKTAEGKPVEASAYYRIAYLREGVRLLRDNPFGTGVGRDAFRRAIHAKYGTAGMSHAHNGFLDLGASVGIPGLILWLAFLVALVRYAARAREAAGSGLRLAMALVVACFAVRTMLDSTLRGDHVVQEFLLVAGVLLGTMALAGRRDGI